MAEQKKQPRKTLTADDMGGGSRVSARYEAAQKTAENANLWALVDSMSAAAANSPEVRKILRERSRYECDNSPDLQAIAAAYVADFIGAKITIQLGESEFLTKVEKDFERWLKAAKIMSKIRTMSLATFKDGECFGVFKTNPKIKNAVKLDLQPNEADMVAGYWTGATAVEKNEVDGIRFDKWGNPSEYRFLDSHPGDHRLSSYLGKQSGKFVSEQYVIHMMRWSKIRPGQVRGVPDTTSILSLPGLLRQFIAATITAAKTAAEIAGVMETTLVPDTEEGPCAAMIPPAATMQLERNSLIALPEGYTMAQMKAEHPNANFVEFCNFIKAQEGRPLNMPRNVAIGDSSGYNYASGRLDHQTWDTCSSVDRDDLKTNVLDRVWQEWLAEYIPSRKASGRPLSKLEIDELNEIDPQWYFKRRKHVDPKKEADADNIRFGNASGTVSDSYAEQGEDGHKKIGEWIQEKISMEVRWNAARVAAKLPPAPFPTTTAPTVIEVTTEAPDNE